MPQISVLGIGNILLKDDGIGVQAINLLKSGSWPAEVRLLEAGCAIFNIIDEIEKSDSIIIMDAIRAGGNPGTIYRFEAGEIELGAGPQFGLHELGLPEILATIAHKGNNPRVVIFGIEPEQIEFSLELSSQVAIALPNLVKKVTQEIKQQLSEVEHLA